MWSLSQLAQGTRTGTLTMYNEARTCCIHVEGGSFSSFEIGWLEGRRAFGHVYQVRWESTETSSTGGSLHLIHDRGMLPAWHGAAATAANPSLRSSPGTCMVLMRMARSHATLEAALSALQSLTAAGLKLHLVTFGTHSLTFSFHRMQPRQAGLWGLARAVRQEQPMLHVAATVICSEAWLLPAAASAPNEHEMGFSCGEGGASLVPRLKASREWHHDRFQLGFYKRGALSNLTVMPQPPYDVRCDERHAELHVRAVGLNFRDVLNVLGEYPGDPGPPGGDCSGTITETGGNVAHLTPGDPVFGFASGSLATLARSPAGLLAPKPKALSWEAACTLPIVWTTTHVALRGAMVRVGQRLLVHAGAGGVGLVALGYACWLGVQTCATAGQPAKHEAVMKMGSRASSSRNIAAFTLGLVRCLQAIALHATLNSLSADFIAVSAAAHGEGSHMEEIGKRAVWSKEAADAMAERTTLHTIAVDMDMEADPMWMLCMLQLLQRRADAGAVHALPLLSFDLSSNAQPAFRLLQRGTNVGKLVLTVPHETDLNARTSSSIVTGGTGGLGLMTARWQADVGVHTIFLASRGGRFAPQESKDQAVLEQSDAEVCLERADVACIADTRRLLVLAHQQHLRPRSIWHTAGVLADNKIELQDAQSLAKVLGSKADGAWALQQCSATTPLKAHAFFSSAAALLGGAGQANYSAANSQLDSIAEYRRVTGLVGVSMQWGPWAEVGMAAAAGVSGRMRSSGFGLISASEGLAVLRAAVQLSSPAVVAMMRVSWNQLLAASTPSAIHAEMVTHAGAKGVREEASCVSANCAPGGGVKLETVMGLVHRTAGGSADADVPLMEAGLDSLGAVELRNQLQQAAGEGMALPSTLVFDHPTARQLALFLQPSAAEAPPAEQHPGVGAAAKLGSVSLDGVSGLLPSGIPSARAFWSASAQARDTIGEVPLSRWDDDALAVGACDALSLQRRRYGGFVLGGELFEPVAFGVSAAEAGATDPQQRLLLERGYAALHASQLVRSALSGALVGIFIGIASTDYAAVLAASPQGGSVYAATGSSLSIASGRLSYALGLHGPCASYDTACSAALTATHAARRALQQAECTRGLASGVNLMLTPSVGTSFAVAGMTSPAGRCHTFDDRADGYARGEACSSVSLLAGEDGRVSACGSAVRQDGRSASLTAPSGLAQQGLLRASLSDGGVQARSLACAEAHGTGTALGDPIEAGSLAAAALVPLGGSGAGCVSLGSGKANVGHAEPAAGASGLLRLVLELEASSGAPNAQLSVLNPHVGSALVGLSVSLSQQLGPLQTACAPIGGVGSFGYSGTIVHAVLQVAFLSPADRAPVRASRRQVFRWCSAPHPFLQSLAPSTSSGLVFSTPLTGALRPLVVDHVVQGRVVFPGAGYLEVGRALHASDAGSLAPVMMHGVFFLQPLAVEAADTRLECSLVGEQFEVRSSAAGDAADVHCSGSVRPGKAIGHASHAHARRQHAKGASIAATYQSLHSSGLEYGPGYRALVQAWNGSESSATARLRQQMHTGTGGAVVVHPADVDGSLQLTRLAEGTRMQQTAETRLPFAVDGARLSVGSSRLWAVANRHGEESASVRLGTQAQLDGFKSRKIGHASATRRDYYSTAWRALARPLEPTGTVLMISRGFRPRGGPSTASSILKNDCSAIVAAVRTAQGQPLGILEAAVSLVQAQASQNPPTPLWLLGSEVARLAHAGAWGLTRSARAETLLPLFCLSGHFKLARSLSAAEPELVLRPGKHLAARLQPLTAIPSATSVRLNFHSRGALSNLFIEPQATIVDPTCNCVTLKVRAIGLNFRDVLNVLGEYPGDPGPPGGDTSGVVSATRENEALWCSGEAVFGLATAPLATFATASNLFLGRKSAALSFEQACTLPITWSTAHAAFTRGEVRAAFHVLVHAAAGGVGLKAIEYAQWLDASTKGSAGRSQKHLQLISLGMNSTCSSRDAAACAVSTLDSHVRLHGVLNSLSLDFIAVSFGMLGEDGVLAEIGKRAIWSEARQKVAAPAAGYRAIALDTDMTKCPRWMQSVLSVLSMRADNTMACSLPAKAFDLESQSEMAFRTLQAGNNTGKIVICVAHEKLASTRSHLVTGGTAGLGLLTGRWLAQRGVSTVALASRSGTASAKSAEWLQLQESSCTVLTLQADVADTSHVQRLMATTQPRSLNGIWHAAGVLADGVLPKQSAEGLARVYAPKAHSMWKLQRASAFTPLAACTLFSSVVALLGGAGQANYAAANACLDAIAGLRRTRAQPSASVQWGAWAEIGMAARGAANERVAAMEAASGFGRVGLAQGLAALQTSVCDGTPAVLSVLPIVWSRMLSGMADVPALLSSFAPRRRRSRECMGEGHDEPVAVGAVSLEAVMGLVHRTAGGSADADVPLMEAGLDSLGAVELRNQLQQAAGEGMALPSTLVFDHPTARQLALFLQPSAAEAPPAEQHPGVGAAAKLGSVSLDGVSGLLPSGIPSARAFWSASAQARDTIGEVPLSRWDDDALAVGACDALSLQRRRYGGFVLGGELFEPVAFGVSAAEAGATDPQQRLLLERGYAALHASQLVRSALSGALVGIFIGIASTDYAAVLAASPQGGSVYAATGSSLSIASGRLSYALGLHGPCASYDTACSAALTATHAARRALQQAECTRGLASGVNLMLTPSVGTSFAVAGMTSPAGRCHTFDDRADGYARGEACSSVSLLAGEDGRVSACGSAVRQDGRSASLTAPSGLAQQGLLRASLSDGGVQARSLACAEAHGTGTALGDPIEAGSLAAAALVPLGGSGAGCVSLGSGKANVGHAEPAAGASGLLRLVLELEASSGAPNAQLSVLNPHVGSALFGLSVSLSQQLGPLQTACAPIGGVGSFGYSGTIVHATASSRSLFKPQSVCLRLLYRRRSFLWRSRSSGLGDLDSQSRCRLSAAVERSLDSALASRVRRVIPEYAAVGVVGAGFAGLLVAAHLNKLGERSVHIFEKTAVVGGVWRHHANAFSRVNSSEPSYRLPVASPQPNTNHSHHSEILGDVLRLVRQYQLSTRIHVGAQVASVSTLPAPRAGTEGWVVAGSEVSSGAAFQLSCRLAVLCTNRRLGAPRHMELAGEASFGGQVFRGLSGDVNNLQCAGQRVVVLGMGAFAIENMRTSFERRASHIHVLCRRRGTVCPQLVDWVNFVRPFDDEFKHDGAGDAVVLTHWHRAYDASGAHRPECWSSGLLKPDGHTVSVSDLFFIGHHMRMLSTACGEVGRLEGSSTVVTVGGGRLEAGVVIKCVGFELNEGNERLLGRARMQSFGFASDGLWLLFEAHLDSHAFSSPFGSSYVNAASFNIKVMLRYWQSAELGARVTAASSSQQLRSYRINRLSVGDMLEGLGQLRPLDEGVSAILTDHVQQIAEAFEATLPMEQYMAQNRRLWAVSHELLEHTLSNAVVSPPRTSTASDRLPYLFDAVWHDILVVEKGIAARPAAAIITVPPMVQAPSSISLERVLQAAREVVGGSALDADAPLMDAGLDSLGATELRASLEKATERTVELPATLVFEAPNVRQITTYIAGRLGSSTANATAPSAQFTQLMQPLGASARPVVISGVALQLPGGARGGVAARRVSQSSIDVVGRVPAARWDCTSASLIEDSALPEAALESITHGGFLHRAQLFDAGFFSISAAEASVADPQHRLLLEDGYAAMHDAAATKASLMGTCSGVFVGIDYTDFQHIVGLTDHLRHSVRAPPSRLRNHVARAKNRHASCLCFCSCLLIAHRPSPLLALFCALARSVCHLPTRSMPRRAPTSPSPRVAPHSCSVCTGRAWPPTPRAPRAWSLPVWRMMRFLAVAASAASPQPSS